MPHTKPPRDWTPGKRLVTGVSAVAALFLVAATGVLLTSCGRTSDAPVPMATSAGGQTQPSTTASPTGSPTASPKPTATSKEAQQAIDDATVTVRKYEAALAEALGAPTIEKVSDLNRFATDPWRRALQENILKQVNFDQRGEYTRELTRADPVSVQLDPQTKIRISSKTSKWKPRMVKLVAPSPVVIMDTCVTHAVVKPLTVNGKKVYKGSKPGDQTFYESRLTLTKPPYLKGEWAITWEDAEKVTSC